MRLCECGCGAEVNNRFVRGHSSRTRVPPSGWKNPHLAGDNNPMRRSENREKFKGDRNPMRRPDVAAKLTGPGHGRWVGDTIGYGGMHDRVRRVLQGQPCSLADTSCKGPIHAALIHGRGTKQEMRDGAMRWYSTRVEDYVPLCDSHHVRYDQHGSATLKEAA
jgi:hypothetical protein